MIKNYILSVLFFVCLISVTLSVIINKTQIQREKIEKELFLYKDSLCKVEEVLKINILAVDSLIYVMSMLPSETHLDSLESKLDSLNSVLENKNKNNKTLSSKIKRLSTINQKLKNEYENNKSDTALINRLKLLLTDY